MRRLLLPTRPELIIAEVWSRNLRHYEGLFDEVTICADVQCRDSDLEDLARLFPKHKVIHCNRAGGGTLKRYLTDAGVDQMADDVLMLAEADCYMLDFKALENNLNAVERGHVDIVATPRSHQCWRFRERFPEAATAYTDAWHNGWTSKGAILAENIDNLDVTDYPPGATVPLMGYKVGDAIWNAEELTLLTQRSLADGLKFSWTPVNDAWLDGEPTILDNSIFSDYSIHLGSAGSYTSLFDGSFGHLEHYNNNPALYSRRSASWLYLFDNALSDCSAHLETLAEFDAEIGVDTAMRAFFYNNFSKRIPL